MLREPSLMMHGYSLYESIKVEINKEIDSIPTKSMESRIQPLFSQIIALLHHKCCTTNFPPTKIISTDQSIHVVSGAVSQSVQVGRAAALKNRKLKLELDAACKAAITAGESLCRLLTQQSGHPGMSPSSSQTGTDSGVEDVDDESGSEILHAIAHDEERLNLHRWILNDLESRRQDHLNDPMNALARDDISSSTSYSDDDIKRSELASACLGVLRSVAQVLKLADRSSVTEVTDSVEQVSESLKIMKRSSDFHKFMGEFSVFGNRMITLAQLTGERQQDLRKDVERARISSSRSVLERGTSLCLATAKLCYQHSTSCLARKCRDVCFERMHIALERIVNVVNISTKCQQADFEGSFMQRHSNEILGLEATLTKCSLEKPPRNSAKLTLFQLLDSLKEIPSCLTSPHQQILSRDDITNRSMTHQSHNNYITKRLGEISDHMKRITSSPYMSREASARVKRAHFVLESVLQSAMDHEESPSTYDDVTSLEEAIRMLAVSHLHDVTMMLRHSHARSDDIDTILGELNKAEIYRNDKNFCKLLTRFKDLSRQAIDATCLAKQCLVDNGLIVNSDHVIECSSYLTEQVTTSIHIVQSLTDSQLAIENLQLFTKQWKSYVAGELDHLVSSLTKSNPTPSTRDAPQSFELHDTGEQTTIARLGLEMKLLSSQCRVEHGHWQRLPSNERTDRLLCSIRKIYDASWNVFSFTRGQPPLNTTANLFACIADINQEADEYSHFSKAFLDDPTESSIRIGKFRSMAASAHSQILSACNCLKTTLRMNAHGRTAVFCKVVTSLQKLKAVLDLVSKLTISLHSIALERSLLSSIPEYEYASASSTVTRHRSMTSPSMQVTPSTSMRGFRSSSRDRVKLSNSENRHCQTGMHLPRSRGEHDCCEPRSTY